MNIDITGFAPKALTALQGVGSKLLFGKYEVPEGGLMAGIQAALHKARPNKPDLLEFDKALIEFFDSIDMNRVGYFQGTRVGFGFNSSNGELRLEHVLTLGGTVTHLEIPVESDSDKITMSKLQKLAKDGKWAEIDRLIDNIRVQAIKVIPKLAEWEHLKVAIETLKSHTQMNQALS